MSPLFPVRKLRPRECASLRIQSSILGCSGRPSPIYPRPQSPPSHSSLLLTGPPCAFLLSSRMLAHAVPSSRKTLGSGMDRVQSQAHQRSESRPHHLPATKLFKLLGSQSPHLENGRIAWPHQFDESVVKSAGPLC